jgi:hypothetical protein
VRRSLLLALLVVTPLGFATKLYSGPGAAWVGNYGGGLVYVIFWILVVLAIAPRLPPGRVAVGVLFVTCGLEVLQLWRPPLLEAIRSTYLGRALVGSTFSWWDFPHYVAGCAAGVGLARILSGRARASHEVGPAHAGSSL